MVVIGREKSGNFGSSHGMIEKIMEEEEIMNVVPK